jgi:outer membrane protein assembly factor BamB
MGRKLLGTLGILLYSLLYAALIVWLLIKFAGLEVEWRGGYAPAFTYHKTVPNYEALERHRANAINAPTLSRSNAPTANAYWTGFRGPNRDGHYEEQPILTNWPSSGLRLLWRQPCGGGYGSFAVAGGVAYTIEQRRDKEVLVAYDVQTGHELWTYGWTAIFTESMGGDGPRSTPTYDEQKIYALGAEGDLFCLEAAGGKVLWSKNILTDNQAGNVFYGMAASPLILEDKLIVQPGGSSGKSVAAYNKLTGAPVWKSLNDGAAYSSPMVVTLAGRQQILIVTATRAVGLAPEDGKLLWEYPWIVKFDNRNIVQPVIVSSNRLLLSASYTTGCAVVEVVPESGGFSARTVWKNKSMKNKFASSVFWQGHIYGLDEDMLACIDAESGERNWKEGRYDYGQLLLASGHLIILSGTGELALVRAIPERYEEISRFQAIHGKTWNVPAIAEGKLLIRNAVEMACVELGTRR